MPITRHLLLGTLVGIGAALPSATAEAQAARPSITEVLVDLDLGTIEVRGAGFGNVRTITLGDDATIGEITDECVIDAASQPDTIVCTLSGGLPPPGDYRLTVARNQALRDSYDLTIGAAPASIESCPAGAAIREVNDDGSVVCEPIDTGVTIDSCPEGSAIREINDDGSVTCETVGSSNLSFDQEIVTIPGSTFGQVATISCAAGETLINGGYDCPAVTSNFAVNASQPVSQTTWQVKFSNSSSTTVQCVIVAQCTD